jgi:hypothetical protein
MSIMQQRTFGVTVGMDALVPTRKHPNDQVICEDTGHVVRHADCFYSVDGTAFEDDEARDERDVDALRVDFEGFIGWSDEYRGSSDCADEYAYLVGEGDPGRVNDAVREWVDYAYGDSKDYPDEMIDDICTDLVDNVEMSVSHGYFGSSNHAVTLDSYECGECEEQIDISSSALLTALHERGDLEDLLDQLDRDFCFYRRSCYDSVTNTRTEGPIVSEGDYPDIILYNNTDIWYHAGVSEETAQKVWDTHAGLLFYRLYALCDDRGDHVRYVAHRFYRPNFLDFDDPAARAEVAKANDWHSYLGCVRRIEFVDHSDFPSESESEHGRIIGALVDIQDDAANRDGMDDDDDNGWRGWADQALEDAKLDYSDRYGPN